jgi:threonine/homoserine/homoserine lactone efflux protein
MLGTQNLGLYIASGLLLNITPGPDTFYILGRSAAQGARAGLLSVAGISTGTAVHTLAAAFGLSALLTTSASAFTVVKLLGAGYLVYLGLRMLLERSQAGADVAQFQPASAWSIYRAGLFTNVLNPKVALFFLAFIPQFVAQGASSKVLAFLFLGAVFITTSTIWCAFLAISAARVTHRLRGGATTAVTIKRITGAVFVGLGVKLAVSK